MDWIVTTARTVDEAQTRALDLLGVDSADAEIQVIEEGKTGLFGRTKTEARVRARIKPKAPPAKEERRQGRNDRGRGRGNNRNNNRGGSRGGNKGNNDKSGNDGGGNRSNNRSKNSGNKGSNGGNRSNKSDGGDGANKGNNDGGGKRTRQAAAAAGAAGGAAAGGSRRNDGGNNRGGGNRGGNRQGGGDRNRRGRDSGPQGEDRVEMPLDEQKETLVAFVRGVASSFDASSTVNLVEEGTTLRAEVEGDDLGLLIGNRASTLGTLEELSRTAMHRAAAGRRYHRIQVDVDGYRARRREALARFAVQIAESVADSGQSKAMEPMNAADRKLVHDAVGEVDGVETISEGRDPRRHIVIRPVEGAIVDEEE